MPKLKKSSGVHRVRRRKKLLTAVQLQGNEAPPTPAKLLAAQVLAFDLPVANVHSNKPSQDSSSPPSNVTHQLQVTPSKLATNFTSTSLDMPPPEIIGTVPERPNFVSSPAARNTTKVTPLKSTPHCAVSAKLNLASFFETFVPSAEKDSVSSSQQGLRANLAASTTHIPVGPVNVTPQKLASKIIASPSISSSRKKEPGPTKNLASFYSEFESSPGMDVMVTPSKLAKSISVCDSVPLRQYSNLDNSFCDVAPLNWNERVEDWRSEWVDAGISITPNARRKDRSDSKILNDTDNISDTSEKVREDIEKQIEEEQRMERMMRNVTLNNPSSRTGSSIASPAKPTSSDKSLDFASEEGSSSSDSEDEEEDQAHNSANSSKVCKCTCTCGADAVPLTELKARPLSYNTIMRKPEKEFRRLTGLSKHNFLVVYQFVGGDDMFSQLKYKYSSSTPSKRKKKHLEQSGRLTYKDRLLITLMRLRRGFSIEDLALFFNVSKSLIGDVCYVVIQLLSSQFAPLRESMFTTRAAQPHDVLPACLKPFKNYRATIDTTEVRIQVPYHYRQQGNTFSDYKSGNVINYLVACNCWGAVSFVSAGFEGSISDVQLFKDSGICNYLHPDDVLLVDRGFTIEALTDPMRVKVVRPAFLKERTVFSEEEHLMNQKISAGRIHIERCIRKIKCFRILKSVTNNMLPILDQIVFVIACLVNFDPPNIQSLRDD